MIPLALASTLAFADPRDPALLGDAEVDATVLIDSCRNASCPDDRRALAEAFLVRATAAAALRGEIDAVGVANARFLDAELVERWGDVVPSGRGDPEAWVRSWADPRPSAMATPVVPSGRPPATKSTEPREPRVRPESPEQALALRGDAPTVLIVGTSGMARRWTFIDTDIRAWTTGAILEADLRAQLAGALAIRATVAPGRHWHVLPVREIFDPDSPDSWTTRGDRVAELRLGLGPRWSAPSGADLAVFASAVGETSASTWRSHSLGEDLPAMVGAGAEIGAVGTLPLPRMRGVALRGEAGGAHVWSTVLEEHLDRRREPDGFLDEGPASAQERDGRAPDTLTGRVIADVRWQPGHSSTSLHAGVGSRFTWRTDDDPWGAPADQPPDLDLIGRVGAGWTF